MSSHQTTSSRRRITIAAWTYPPDQSPRGYRTYELVKELSRRHFLIDLIIFRRTATTPQTENTVIHSVLPAGDPPSRKGSRKRLQDYPRLQSMVRYVFGQYFWRHERRFRRILKTSCSVGDLIISIGLPMTVHVAVARSKEKTPGKRWIADFGDPHFGNETTPVAPYHKWIERFFLRDADLITCPTKIMCQHFARVHPGKPIMQMPQAVDTQSFAVAAYAKNTFPVFGFAGTFYLKHRWPEFFFRELQKIRHPYKFIIYTPYNSHAASRMAKEAFERLLPEQVEFRCAIPRHDVIYELSQMDFLVSFASKGCQRPSKLIDYALTGRPFLSLDQERPDFETFYRFLAGDYSSFDPVDLTQWDIGGWVDKLLAHPAVCSSENPMRLTKPSEKDRPGCML